MWNSVCDVYSPNAEKELDIEMTYNIHLSEKDINIIIEELNIQGNHQELVDNIKEEYEMLKSANDVYCGRK